MDLLYRGKHIIRIGRVSYQDHASHSMQKQEQSETGYYARLQTSVNVLFAKCG